MARLGIIFGVLALCSAVGCTHKVGWDPIRYETQLTQQTAGPVSLYMDERLKTAQYAFRAFGSGLANEWVVPYGERVHQFAAGYFSQVFSDYTEVQSPHVPRGILLTITDVTYEVSGQAAHISVSLEASDATGRPLLTHAYSAVGPSGAGAVWGGGGAFAQEGMVRRSTNRALHEIFQKATTDLLKAMPR
jgi:hypothetical protein